MPAQPEILLIDADRRRGMTLRGWFRQWGYRVETVTNSLHACEALKREESPAIVVAMLQSYKTGSMEVATLCGQARMDRPLHILAGLMAQPAEKERQQLAEIAPGVRPDDVFVLPLEPRLLRGKLRSAERVVEVQQELAQASRALRFFSTHDALTALPHRTAAMETLRRESDRSLRTGAPLSVILFDIAMFQAVNARAGYDAGNAVLREAGSRLRRTMRGYDVVCRFGSDEFFLMLPECSLPDAVHRAERLLHEVFGDPFPIDSEPVLRSDGAKGDAHQVRLSGCFGVAESGGRHPNQLLQEAEQALRAAKQQGPGSVVSAAAQAAAALPQRTDVRRAPERERAMLQ